MRTVLDRFGDAWEVVEARPTPHGFDLLLGFPLAGRRGRGGKSVVCTSELVAYLESRRYPARGVHLPIGHTTIKGLRALLGLRWLDQHAAWWEERTEDLADFTLEAFAERYGVSASVAANARLALLGPRLRPAGWWREPDAAALLAGPRPVVEVAQTLGLAAGSVRRMRSVLRAERTRDKAVLHPASSGPDTGRTATVHE